MNLQKRKLQAVLVLHRHGAHNIQIRIPLWNLKTAEKLWLPSHFKTKKRFYQAENENWCVWNTLLRSSPKRNGMAQLGGTPPPHDTPPSGWKQRSELYMQCSVSSGSCLRDGSCLARLGMLSWPVPEFERHWKQRQKAC